MKKKTEKKENEYMHLYKQKNIELGVDRAKKFPARAEPIQNALWKVQARAGPSRATKVLAKTSQIKSLKNGQYVQFWHEIQNQKSMKLDT